MEVMCMESPLGWLKICCNEKAIIAIDFVGNEIPFLGLEEGMAPNPLLVACKAQLEEYFEGRRTRFTVPVEPKGTPFQQKVYQALQNIPYGECRSYKEIAEEVGCPKGMRAVGGANHNNPIPILIPCHRVVGVRGNLVGYAGGLHIKEWLLIREGALREKDGK